MAAHPVPDWLIQFLMKTFQAKRKACLWNDREASTANIVDQHDLIVYCAPRLPLVEIWRMSSRATILGYYQNVISVKRLEKQFATDNFDVKGTVVTSRKS